MNKNRYIFLAAPAALLLAGAAALFVGCEASSPDQSEIKVSPQYVSIAPGGSVELTASGWHAYKWSLDTSGAGGYLSATTGTKVNFTAFPGKRGEQIVYVDASDHQPEASRNPSNSPPATVVSRAAALIKIE